MKHLHKNVLIFLSVEALVLLGLSGFAQEPAKTVPDGTEGETIAVLDSTSTNKTKPWNTFNLGFTSLKIGAAFLYEYAGFTQDDVGKQQMDSANVDLKSAFDVRDFRVYLSGKFKAKRTIIWKAGIMYDGASGSWLIRESGIMIAVPELWGNFFIGRTKEGISMSKVMNGYSIETMERHMALDPIPILADGIKWLGFLPEQRIFWNIGAYADWLSKGQGFSTYSSQFVSRVGWLPIHSDATKTNLHIAASIRLGSPVNDSIRLRSRPEANPAPYFIDTKKFASDQATFIGGEIYYSTGSWLFGTEYYWDKFNSPGKGNPVFHGGELLATYIFTGESRPYSTESSIYTFINVKKSVFKGGTGAVEGVLRFSTLDLDDGGIQGGKFWRITPMVNWYLTDYLRFEVAYGYGVLNRFNLEGSTQFFQSRIQLALR